MPPASKKASDSLSDRDAHALPFVSSRTTRVNYWKVDRTGDYAANCARGRAYAEALLSHIQEAKNPVILGSVMKAMIAAGVYEGVEIGFCAHLGIALVRS